MVGLLKGGDVAGAAELLHKAKGVPIGLGTMMCEGMAGSKVGADKRDEYEEEIRREPTYAEYKGYIGRLGDRSTGGDVGTDIQYGEGMAGEGTREGIWCVV